MKLASLKNERGSGEAVIFWLMVGALFVWFTSGGNANSRTKRRFSNSAYASTAPKSSRGAVTDFCAKGERRCLNELAHRTVQINTERGLGTGTIYSATENTAIILTASHVIRFGNGFDSAIRDGLAVWDTTNAKFMPVRRACAYFMNSHSDIALIEVENNRNQQYPSLNQDPGRMYAGQKVLYVSNRKLEQEAWEYTVWGFDNRRQDMVLRGKPRSGDSGSGIFTKDGHLAGVLNSYEWDVYRTWNGSIPYNQRTRATYRFDLALMLADGPAGLEFQYEHRKQEGVQYICREFR